MPLQNTIRTGILNSLVSESLLNMTCEDFINISRIPNIFDIIFSKMLLPTLRLEFHKSNSGAFHSPSEECLKPKLALARLAGAPLAVMGFPKVNLQPKLITK